MVAGRAIINGRGTGNAQSPSEKLLWGGYNIWSSSGSICTAHASALPAAAVVARISFHHRSVYRDEKNTRTRLPAGRRDYADTFEGGNKRSRGKRHIKKELWSMDSSRGSPPRQLIVSLPPSPLPTISCSFLAHRITPLRLRDPFPRRSRFLLFLDGN